MKIRFKEEEWYPVFSLVENPKAWADYEVDVSPEVGEKLIEDLNRVEKEFDELQKKIKELCK